MLSLNIKIDVFSTETPETSALFLPPSLEDAYTLRVEHRHIFVGEDHLAALIGKRPQAYKGCLFVC
jgi:hypothetical protein